MMRAVLVAALVLIAGCSAIPGTGTDIPSNSTPTADSPTPDGSSTDGELTPGMYRPVVFEDPGRYVFSISTQYETDPGRVEYDVRSTALSNTEIAVDAEFAGNSHQTTISGNRIEVSDGLQTLDSGTGSIEADMRIFETIFEPGAWTLGRTLDVGQEWGATIGGVAGEDSVDSTLTVTGTKTIGGVECYALEGIADEDGRTVYEGCLAPGHGFPMQSIYYDSSGQVASLLELQSYDPA